MKAIINLLLFLAAVAYPIYWLWGENAEILAFLPLIMGVLWALKAWFEKAFMRYFSCVIAILLIVIGLTRTTEMMYSYPIIINGLMLIVFGSTLWQKQTIIERFARMQTPDLSEQGIRYTRKVTQLWCGFFLLNITVSIATIYTEQHHYWALYNGVISYLLMGILMIGEWIVRQYVKKQHEI